MARTDIRNDGRPVHLAHASARGERPRNSGNFTRGSQLLDASVRMWLQGAKMPILIWLGTFLIAYATILSIRLNENNFQLISMRILSSLWDWVALDNLKKVNLRMPDNSVHSTVMGYVPYVPEVARAWTKAVRGFLGSSLLATFVAIPLSIWYFSFSTRRGAAMMEDRHERGAMLVPRDLLFKEIAAFNLDGFTKDAATFFPGVDPKVVLKKPFAERKAAGIHHPYSIAGIPYPHRLEQSHTMLIGTTGSGKTTALRALLKQMRERHDTAVVFDLTGAYVEAFYDPDRDTILNPLDTRCPSWSVFDDCKTQSELTAAAAALIPSDGGSADPFWVLAARTLFIEMCMKLIENGEATNKALAENLMTADLKHVHRYLKETIADPLTAPEAARMAEAIRAVYNTNAKALLLLPEDQHRFSIKQWITSEKKPGSILFITCSYTDLEMNRTLLTLWTNLAVHSLMTMPHTRSLRTWFFFDEIGALHRLPAIEQGLQTARNYGGAIILGIHSFDKLVQVYGEENARNLSSLARTKLILASADLDTAEQCARYIGNREIRQMDEGYSYGYNSTRDASTLTPRTQIEALVIPDDITNLPAMHGFIKFPEGFPAARIRLEWQHYPRVADGFVKRRPAAPDDEARRGKKGGVGKRPDEDGRDSATQPGQAEVEPRNPNVAMADAILSAPTEGQIAAQEQVQREAAQRLDPNDPGVTPGAKNGRGGAQGQAQGQGEGKVIMLRDLRDARTQAAGDARADTPQATRDVSSGAPTPAPQREDQTIVEVRQDFSAGDHHHHHHADRGDDLGID